jgi:hypothetical protein
MEPTLSNEDLELELNRAVAMESICRRNGEAQAASHYAAVQRALKAELGL